MSWFSDLFSGGVDTTQQSTSVPEWMQPYVANYLQSSQNVANQPYTPYSGQTVAQLNPFQVQGLNAQAQRAAYGSPVMDAASGELQKTLSGGYLGNNPYLTGMIDAASQDVTRNYNESVIPQLTAIDARSGSFGNSGVASATGTAQGQLAQQLGNIATNVRGNDYAAERGRMQSAVGQAPGIANQDYIDTQAMQAAGQGFQANNQANLTDQYQRFQEAQAYPYKQLQTLGNGLGLNFGSTTTMQTPGTSPAATGLGTAASLYGLSNSKSPTIICTELHRQGLMPDDIYALDQAFGAWVQNNDPAVYAGYIRLAAPVVRKMQKSRAFSAVVARIATPWAKHMAHTMGHPGGDSITGRAMMWAGKKLCRSVAKPTIVEVV